MNNANQEWVEKVHKLAYVFQTQYGHMPLKYAEIVSNIETLLPFLAIPHFPEWNLMSDAEKKQVQEAVIDWYVKNVGITSELPSVLEDHRETEFWLYKAKEKVECKHFELYKQYLVRKGYSEDVITKLTQTCEQILARCANPNETNEADRKKKGLVVGDVQSGKTTNYMGVINLAFDYGYKIVVILAGSTNSLRLQTQKRTDACAIGAISDTICGETIYTGIGSEKRDFFVVPFTDQAEDFKSYVNKGNHIPINTIKKPVILVVKKVKSILENVCERLQSEIEKYQTNDETTSVNSKSLLIIDDEADSASVNTSANPDKPSAINKCIRDIFNKFPTATYLGYTATPFANVFIQPDNDEDGYSDLFPKDFIFLLEAPSNYYGGWRFFPQEGETLPKCIRRLEPTEPDFLPVSHKRDYKYRCLAESLKKAILKFIIDNVIRTLRGQTKEHRSMMINISRFNDVQRQILERVNEYVTLVKNAIEQLCCGEFSDFIANEEMKKMYDIFMHDPIYDEIRTQESFKWGALQKRLYDEIKAFQIVVINARNGDIKFGSSGKRFDYDDYKDTGARVIAIGGMVLSRGLTLEGLMTSYYSRNAGTYDTLLQMCRWFGYRPDYEDLCSIYLSNENIQRFRSALEAVDDMKRQFKEMARDFKKPSNFGLMIRENPYILETQLLITARNKCRGTETMPYYLNYGGVYADTSKLYKDADINKKNKEMVDSLYEEGIFDSNGFAENVSKEIVSKFIKKLTIPYLNKKFDVDGLSDYIKDHDLFTEWDVVIESGSSKVLYKGVNAVQRSFDVNDVNDKFIRLGGLNNRVMEPGVFKAGMSEDDKVKLDEILHEKQNDSNPKKRSKSLGISDYLSVRKKPLLVIYPIELTIKNSENDGEKKKELEQKRPVLEAAKSIFGCARDENSLIFAFAFGFPKKESEKKFIYRLNKRKQDEIAGEVETEDDGESIDEN